MNVRAGSEDVSVEAGCREARAGKRLFGRREKGSSLIEFALVMTFLLVPTVVGMAEFATYLENYLALTDAVAAGSRTLAISRGTLNPCSAVGAAVTPAYQAAAIQSGVNPPALIFTVTLTPPAGSPAQQTWTGSAYPGGCASGSATTGYPANMVQGGVASVNVKFTPTLIFNVFPFMQIQAQTTEIVQ